MELWRMIVAILIYNLSIRLLINSKWIPELCNICSGDHSYLTCDQYNPIAGDRTEPVTPSLRSIPKNLVILPILPRGEGIVVIRWGDEGDDVGGWRRDRVKKILHFLLLIRKVYWKQRSTKPWWQSHLTLLMLQSLLHPLVPLLLFLFLFILVPKRTRESTGHVSSPLAKYCTNTGASDNELTLGLTTLRNLNIPYSLHDICEDLHADWGGRGVRTRFYQQSAVSEHDGTEFGEGMQGPSEESSDEGTARRGEKGRTDCLIMFYILLCMYQLLVLLIIPLLT